MMLKTCYPKQGQNMTKPGGSFPDNHRAGKANLTPLLAWCRCQVYEILTQNGIDVPRYMILNRPEKTSSSCKLLALCPAFQILILQAIKIWGLERGTTTHGLHPYYSSFVPDISLERGALSSFVPDISLERGALSKCLSLSHVGC